MLMPQFKFYRSPDAPEGGTGAAGGNPPDAAALEQKEFDDLSAKDAATLTPEEKTKFTTLQAKYEKQYLDDKGNALTPDQIKVAKETEAKFNAILAKPEDQWTEDEKKFVNENQDPGETKPLYELVDEIRGTSYEIDYGDIDPASPDGIALREEEVASQGAREFEATLKEKYPRAYQFFMHQSNGGKEEDFFKPENTDFKSLTISKDDKASQEKALRLVLAAKGNAPAIIDALITATKDSGTIYELAKSELEALQAVQTEREKQAEERNRQVVAKQQSDYAQFGNTLDTLIEKGFEGSLIPVKERQAFRKFFTDQIDYQNGVFFSVNRLNLAELSKAVKVAYFNFKGGDLKGLAERTAKTQQAIKFKKQIVTKTVPKGNGNAGGKHYVPIGDL